MEQKENLEKKNKFILGGVIMDKVCVIGLGSWGSALALTLCKNGCLLYTSPSPRD